MSMDMDFAEGWRPAEGDTLIGQVVEVDRGWSTWTNSYYPIVTIQPEGTDGKDERVAVHAFHTTLRNKLAELRPVPGERLGIVYKGEQPLKSDAKRTVHVYVAKVDGREPADVWAGFETGREVTPTPTSDIPADDKNDLPF